MNRKENRNAWTIAEIIKWGTQYLADKKIESPRLTIELILCDILKLTRLELYLNYAMPLKSNELNLLKTKIKELLRGFPLQYVLGWSQFLNYKILLNKKVFIPRPETEYLANLVRVSLKHKKDEKLKILDIGCGSGALAIALADYFKQSEVYAIDIDENAIEQTKENAKINKVENLAVFKMDILEEKPNEHFDIIVSNPPYIPLSEYEVLPKEVKKEPKFALTDGNDGLTFYRRFAEIFPEILSDKFAFFLEVGWNQAEVVSKLFYQKDYEVKIENDFQGIKRIVYSIRF